MLYFDIDQRALVRAPGSDQWIGQNRGKRGDTLPLSVTILRGAVVEDLEDVTEMVFAVKAAYGDADPLILADDFTEAAGVWTAPMAMNTEGVDEALGGAEKIDLLAEFTFTSSLGTISSQVITFALYRDLWTGEEGTPLALPTPEEWLAARAVLYDDEQSLTDPQKASARGNIGLGTAATRNTGTSEGDLPLLGSGGKLPSSLLPELAHASTHATGGSDPITPASIGAETPAGADAKIAVETAARQLTDDALSYQGGGAAAMEMLLASGLSASFWVAGDSTGNADTEWVGRFGSYLATKYPAHRVILKTWITNQYVDSVLQNPNNGARRLRWGASAISSVNFHTLEVPIPNYTTTDLDISVGMACDDWATGLTGIRLSRGTGGSPPLDFRVITGGTNKIRLRLLSDAGSFAVDSTVGVVPPANGSPLWIRVNFDRDDGAGNRVTKFYTSTNGVAWTQLGDTITTATIPVLTAITDGWTLAANPNTTVYGIKIRTSENGKIYNNQAQDHWMYGSISLSEGMTYLGDPEIIIYNLSVPGWTTNSALINPAGFDAMEPHGTCFVMLSLGHNDSYAGGTNPTDGLNWAENGLKVLFDRMAERTPAVPGIVIGQNPTTWPSDIRNDRLALRFSLAARWCATNDYRFINVHRAYRESSTPLTDLVEQGGDNTHPTTAGNILWANTIIRAYERGLF